ncbi:phosphate ABC transporter substrate-binding protein PstS [Thermocrinis minervae]|uniref:Phosphate-binding protein n=1 Tax=Thermocrinis minervae TaxID=381751 RepID=A0A1M6RWC6_9AQUI|nr:phosphate ABC transporter substrate-binding protein PstS [Thermocrinis minervae]SHK36740.1 phosphate ABC transporter substrate-binding protein, PhoT family [Thermocrinis minervae]
MKKAIALLTLVGSVAMAVEITGAGSTFVYPILSRWAYEYGKATGNKVNYQSIGSGGGIRQIINRTVDFGASDAPLEPEELKKHNLLQFPIVIGGVVLTYNIPGVRVPINLDGQTVCHMYLGEIKSWNDPSIQKLNPNVKLPNVPIVVVHRSDGSGTTWIFTNWLSKVCPEWKGKVGYGTSVNWPAGIGAKGSEGVANYTRRTTGAIGYVEYIYAKQNNLPMARVKNRAGMFVEPSIKTFQAAAANASWKKEQHFYEILTDQPGKDSYPIAGATFILLAKDQPERSKKAVQFFKWIYDHGDRMAESLNYIPMPQKVKKLIEDYWKENGVF